MTKAVEPKYLREYRCSTCSKLLCKGFLKDSDSFLEVKCRGCGLVQTFIGEGKDIVETRAVLLKQGAIPDTE